MADYYIGLMSGTSLDAIDVVLVDFEPSVQLIESHSMALPDDLRQAIKRLNQVDCQDLSLCLSLDRQLGQLFAQACLQLLDKSSLTAKQIKAIGSHGQTIRHAPNASPAYSLQIGDGNTIAELTGINVVADFRRRDIAAGGQGAPLAPLFHQAFFSSDKENRAIINIGGMANISLLRAGQITGFDTGPGNVLLDSWMQQSQGQPLDKDGLFAASGHIIEPLLKQLLSDDYFQQAAPKSTGREQFDWHWLQPFLTGHEAPEDVQATLSELTAQSICQALSDDIDSLYLCGGGASNGFLLKRIQQISAKPTFTTQALGIAPDWLEAIGFAWLAKQTLTHQACSLSAITGAKGARILGAIYQA